MFIVYDKNMNIKPFPKGVRPLDIFISSMEKHRTSDSIEGSNRIITKGHTHGVRPIQLLVGLMAHDTRDYRLLRDEVFSFFDDEEFFVAEVYQRGKLYKVSTLQSYIPERLNQRVAQAQFALDVVDLPYAQSKGTTQDIHNRGINADDELWGFGMGLIADNDSLKYTHTGTRFKIFNAGNEPIHPFEQELKITINDVVGSSSHLELRNITNGTIFRVNEAVSNNQRIVIDGANIRSNDLAFLRKTNRKYIELEPGWNEFEIRGASRATVAFDFRFYYK